MFQIPSPFPVIQGPVLQNFVNLCSIHVVSKKTRVRDFSVELSLVPNTRERWRFVAKEQIGDQWMEDDQEVRIKGSSGFVDLSGSLEKAGQHGQTLWVGHEAFDPFEMQSGLGGSS